jgi:hypothetical protein
MTIFSVHEMDILQVPDLHWLREVEHIRGLQGSIKPTDQWGLDYA